MFLVLELLPSRSISTFAYEVLSQTADFERLNSLVAVNAKEVLPIFIIGGLSTVDAVRQLAARLYYPVYCARLPSSCTSLTTVAMMLAKVSKNIFTHYNYFSNTTLLALTLVQNLAEPKKMFHHDHKSLTRL